MKARVSAVSLLSRKEKADLEAYISERSKEAMRRYMMLTAVVLSESHGFGSGRLIETFDCMSELLQVHAPDDEEFWTHVEQRCKQLKMDRYLDL